jgi:CBS domain-containing protein
MDAVVRNKIERYIRSCKEKNMPHDAIVKQLEKAGIHKEITAQLLKRIDLENYFIYDENKLVDEKRKIEKAQEEFRKGSSLKVDTVMSFPVQTIDVKEPLKTAITLMVEKSIGALVVTEKGKPLGMVSERDMLTKVLDKELNIKRVTVEEIMNAPLIYIEAGESLIEAETKMKLNGIRRIPILKDGELVGIITSTDIIRIMAFI